MVETVVLDAISNHLTNPTLLYEYAKAYQEERRALNRGKFAKQDEMKSRVATLEKSTAKLLDLILADAGDSDQLTEKMTEQAKEKKRLVSELDEMEQPDVAIDLHPAAIKQMAEAIGSVRRILNRGIDDSNEPAMTAVREALCSVVVHKRLDLTVGVEVEITGRFAALEKHGPMDGNRRRMMASGIPLVAEEGLEPPTRGL